MTSVVFHGFRQWCIIGQVCVFFIPDSKQSIDEGKQTMRDREGCHDRVLSQVGVKVLMNCFPQMGSGDG